jgi:enoyl-CoA hydratase/carnithine racemase
MNLSKDAQVIVVFKLSAHLNQGRCVMVRIFNYQCLSAELDKTTRTLWVKFNKDYNHLNLELLFELESLFSWLTNKVEVTSVVMTNQNLGFGSGGDYKNWASYSEKTVNRIVKKVRQLSFSMMHLPQTFIVDFGEECRGISLELALGADIRIARTGSRIGFDHNQFGLIAASGAMSILQKIVSPSLARFWIMSGSTIPQESLLSSGLVSFFYDETNREQMLQSLLKSIHTQAPTQRIQSKSSLLEAIKPGLEEMMKFEDSVFKASMMNQDWKQNAPDAEGEFMPAKNMAHTLKLSIVKNLEMQDN